LADVFGVQLLTSRGSMLLLVSSCQLRVCNDSGWSEMSTARAPKFLGIGRDFPLSAIHEIYPAATLEISYPASRKLDQNADQLWRW
jgi:hypothetical protein